MAAARLTFQQRSLRFIERFVIFKLILPGVRVLYGAGEIFCQQDGAPEHYYLAVHAFLDDNLQGHWIGRRGPIELPDLTPMDFYLWPPTVNILNFYSNHVLN
ncbi:hypothetical protein C0J52_17501 [Blattella germanica]|nr:hypothetical protein C0J52_17501 [Blattella germanica]